MEVVLIKKKSHSKNYTELIEAVKTGDQKATTELYNIINPFCRNIIRQKKYGICIENLNVLAHEITTKILLKKLHKYTYKKEFFSWLFVVISNQLVDLFRKEKNSIFYSKNLVEITENTIHFFAENEEYFFEENTRLIDNGIQSLSPLRQELIFLKYYEKKTTEEIAELKNKSVRAIASELFRTRAVLKRILLKGGYKGSGKK